jgi:outer membrane cobalamin receptor
VKRYTLSAAVAALIFGAGATSAQEAQPTKPAAAPTEAEEIVITGSRIKRTDLVANSPVSIVDAEELSLTQTLNVEDAIREMPQAVPGISPGVNNGNPGVATVNCATSTTSARWCSSTASASSGTTVRASST